MTDILFQGNETVKMGVTKPYSISKDDWDDLSTQLDFFDLLSRGCQKPD